MSKATVIGVACDMRLAALLRRLAACVLLWVATLATADAQNLNVFSAASLKESLDEVARSFEREHGQRVSIAYAASSALARQIENGAPADIFISADLDWMDYLAQRQLIKAATRVNLLGNEIVVIAPADSKTTLKIAPGMPLAGLLGDGRLALADPDTVPAGKYARAALVKLGVWGSVEKKLARGENVRAALTYVARGEAPLGIVYRTDAYAEKRVRVLATFPADTHPSIIYPAALVAAGRNPAAAILLGYLQGREARLIFEKYGFIMGR
jgi:molybdate transport system substrate-binding protein